MKRYLFILLSLFVVFGLVGCSNGIDDEKIAIRGEITQITLDDSQQVIAILVEGELQEDTEYDKAMIGITEETKILKADDSKKVDKNMLEEGMTVEVVFTGPVAESYPVQAVAKTIWVR